MLDQISKTDLLQALQGEKAKRSLAYFVERTSGFTLHPWQLLLCQRLERLKNEKGQRILIHAPPQVGKSQILSKRFPLWMLGHNRLARVVIAAYNKTQAVSMVNSCKITSEHEIAKWAFGLEFPKWNDDSGGFTVERLKKADSQPSIIGIGLDSGFTGKGADCFVAGTKVSTPCGDVNIEDIEPGMTVYGYNIDNDCVEQRTVIAVRRKKSKEIARATTESGQTVTSTADHRFYTLERGYAQVRTLTQRETLVTLAKNSSVPQLPKAGRCGKHHLQSVQGERAQYRHGDHLPDVPENVLSPSVRDSESIPEVLLSGVCGDRAFADIRRKVREVPQTDTEGSRGAVLLEGVQDSGKGRGCSMSTVPDDVPAQVFTDGLLLSQLREQSPRQADERGGELQVQERAELRQAVQGDATSYHREGFQRLPVLRDGDGAEGNQAPDNQVSQYARCASYRPQPGEQSPGELDLPLRELPCVVPQVERSDRIRDVQISSGVEYDVYDIQVEGTSNFFANGILVHNCLIVDDPYANAEQARSEAYTASVRSFWEETAEPRLMANPDANVVVMFHRYHENDIAGYLQTRGDWEMLRFPAIADGLEGDPTNREVGEVLSPFLTVEQLIRKREEDPKTFAGQFQGVPLAEGEKMFEPWMFEDRFITPEQCPPIKQWYRGVDTATKDKEAADDTATCKVAYTPEGDLILRDFKTAKKSPAALNEWLGEIIERDGLHVTTIVEQHNAGYGVVSYMQRKDEFKNLVKLQEIGAKQGGKRQRAFILGDLAYNRKVYIVKEGEWQKFYSQLLAFTGIGPSEKDDMIDAVTVVTTYLKEQSSTYERKSTYKSRYRNVLAEV